jgi:peptidoglycan/xylan/chitin deacetylase (PgdA/CDA1 family)
MNLEYHEFVKGKSNDKWTRNIDNLAQDIRQTHNKFYFDDGLSSQFVLAMPLLNKAGIRGKFFINCKNEEATDKAYMTWEQIRELAKHHDIEVHGYTHKRYEELTLD